MSFSSSDHFSNPRRSSAPRETAALSGALLLVDYYNEESQRKRMRISWGTDPDDVVLSDPRALRQNNYSLQRSSSLDLADTGDRKTDGTGSLSVSNWGGGYASFSQAAAPVTSDVSSKTQPVRNPRKMSSYSLDSVGSSSLANRTVDRSFETRSVSDTNDMIYEVGVERYLDTVSAVDVIEKPAADRYEAPSSAPRSRIWALVVFSCSSFTRWLSGSRVEDITTQDSLGSAEQCTATISDPDESLDRFDHRLLWLIVLMVLQSMSQFILQAFNSLIVEHPDVVYFLTMLVGAGGNAGSQSTVLAIRGITRKQLDQPSDIIKFIMNQLWIGFKLSLVLTFVCFLRVWFFDGNLIEVAGICVSMFVIVFISVLLGTFMPLGMRAIGWDPAHASAGIQVTMDIVGVSITCILCAAFILFLSPYYVPKSQPKDSAVTPLVHAIAGIPFNPLDKHLASARALAHLRGSF